MKNLDAESPMPHPQGRVPSGRARGSLKPRPGRRQVSAPEPPERRLLAHGAAVLSDAELLAVFLEDPPARAMRLAPHLLDRLGGLDGLIGSERHALLAYGASSKETVHLLAAFELTRRLAAGKVLRRPRLKSSRAVARFIALQHVVPGQEILGALYLDAHYHLLASHELFRGGLARVPVDPRPVLVEGLLRGASTAIVFHTHPSGDPTPSREDIHFTRRIRAAGDLVGLEIADHLIVGHGGRWVSLRQRGPW